MKMKIMKTIICAFVMNLSTQLLIPSTASAQQVNSIEKPVLFVQYLKEEDGFLWFKVTITQLSEKKSVMKILGNYQETLYRDFFSENNYCRTYKFPKEEIETLEFNFSDGNELQKKQFEIKTKVEETSYVNEIKLKK